MAQLQQVFRGLPAAGDLVRDDVMQLRLGMVVVAVGQDGRDTEHPLRNLDGLQANGHIHEPVNLPVQEGLNGARIPGGIALRVHDHGDESPTTGNIVCATNDVAVKGADHYFVGQDADHTRALVPQAQGNSVGGVVQFQCSLPDPVLTFLGHVPVATSIQNQRDRAPGHTRPLGDVQCSGLAVHGSPSVLYCQQST
ncbi:hypothetical protein D3C73_991740 [compost metagenome]